MDITAADQNFELLIPGQGHQLANTEDFHRPRKGRKSFGKTNVD